MVDCMNLKGFYRLQKKRQGIAFDDVNEDKRLKLHLQRKCGKSYVLVDPSQNEHADNSTPPQKYSDIQKMRK